MTTMRLLGGPCDPRDVTMTVTADAAHVSIRPMPFACQDVYAITSRSMDDESGSVELADGQYLYTDGPRRDVDAYRRTLLRLGTGRAFLLKRKRAACVVH